MMVHATIHLPSRFYLLCSSRPFVHRRVSLCLCRLYLLAAVRITTQPCLLRNMESAVAGQRLAWIHERPCSRSRPVQHVASLCRESNSGRRKTRSRMPSASYKYHQLPPGGNSLLIHHSPVHSSPLVQHLLTPSFSVHRST